MELDDEQFDDEVENLIEWCEDLDYDKYIENWHQQATSADPVNQDDDKKLHFYEMGLGELTVGLAQPDSPGMTSPDAQYASHKMELSGYKASNIPDNS